MNDSIKCPDCWLEIERNVLRFCLRPRSYTLHQVKLSSESEVRQVDLDIRQQGIRCIELNIAETFDSIRYEIEIEGRTCKGVLRIRSPVFVTENLSEPELLELLPYFLASGSIKDSRLGSCDKLGFDIRSCREVLPLLTAQLSAPLHVKVPAYKLRSGSFSLVKDLREADLSLLDRFREIASAACIITDSVVDILVAEILGTRVGKPQVLKLTTQGYDNDLPVAYLSGERERQKLLECVRSRGGVVVEIGVLWSGTPWLLSQNVDIDYIYFGIDPELSVAYPDADPLHLKKLPNSYYIRGDSTFVSEHFDLPIDVLFIDGSHLYEQVVSDLELWSPKVRYGGVICGHDYGLMDVKVAVDEVIGEPDLVVEGTFFKEVDAKLYERLNGITAIEGECLWR